MSLQNFASGALLCGAFAMPALAHGGSHPTPWPSNPSGGTPSSGSGGSSGSGRKGTKTGGGAPGSASWETWWELNKWHYTKAARADVVLSGGGTEIPGVEEANKAKTILTAWLLKQSEHDYYDIRSAAALALGKSGDTKATDRLIAMIDDSNKEVQESAVLALGLMKDEKVLPILAEQVLSDKKKPNRLRSAAAIAMGFIGSKAATPKLVQAYYENKDEKEIQYGVLAGLGLLHDESAAPHLWEVLVNPKVDGNLRAYAATALGKCGCAKFHHQKAKKDIKVADFLMRTAMSERKERMLRRSCVQAIGALEAVDQFEKIYRVLDMDKDQTVRDFAALVLARLASKGSDKHKTVARTKLEKLLTGRHHQARGYAAIALGLLGEKQSAVQLRKSFENESAPSTKAACAIGLGLLKDESAVPALRGTLMASNNAKLRGYCCIALGMIGHAEAAKQLQTVVEDAMTPEVKAAAAISLAMMGNQKALGVLLKSLQERSNYVRQSTIVALGYFRNTRAIAPIQKVFNEQGSNKETKAICIVSLGYIIDRFDVPVFKELAVDFNHMLPGEMVKQVLKLF